MSRKIKFKAHHPTIGWAWNLRVGTDGLEEVSWNGGSNVDTSFSELAEWTLVEFTGLLDKDGKEIFEGDILEIYYTNPLIGMVKFCYGQSNEADGEWKVEYAKWVLVKHNVQEYHNSYHLSSEKYRKVIGNIFENPELLK